MLKCLTIVDDATTEAVAIVPARALGGLAVTRVLERLAATRGLPQVLRTDNGPEFCGRAMLTWAHERGVTLRLIDAGQADAERVRRIVQRPLPRRMPQRALVHQPGACPSRHRDVATGIQRGATEEGTRRADARRLRQTADEGNGYSHRRTLKPTATQDGGTSTPTQSLLMPSPSISPFRQRPPPRSLPSAFAQSCWRGLKSTRTRFHTRLTDLMGGNWTELDLNVVGDRTRI